MAGDHHAPGTHHATAAECVTRIIAGTYRGRRLRAPADRRVRPTADRVREAWFSIVGERIDGAGVLDLFAGTGALGLEALSRGAVHATFVELGHGSLEALRANVASLHAEERTTVHRADALRFVRRLGPNTYDVAFADPPYTTEQAVRLAATYRTHPFAGLLGIEHPASIDLDGTTTHRYGDIALTFFEPS